MDLDLLDDFLALADTRHFTKAAERRHTTQPAYSRRIMRLEHWLGCLLFKRDTRPVELTPQGLSFLPRARQIRVDILDVRRNLQSMRSYYQTPNRLYTTNSLAIGFLPLFLSENKMETTSIVVASVNGCLEAVQSGIAEAAIIPKFRSLSTSLSMFSQETIGSDHLRLIVHESRKQEIRISKKSLVGPFMLYTPGTLYGQAIGDKIQKEGLAFDSLPVCESPSAEALLAQVINKKGCAWIPDLLIKNPVSFCLEKSDLNIPYDIVKITSK